ncbi:hypothetical protein L6164_037328 [Bauhinia variegata]|uniref:Uncharacterized protein n=1 Tax=Bauhinia variegata TaxID=167791 RepID=A0ACB9KJW7_BAUVA|nr:hypothetical protein L6164_037328 [Bauhinia variegata]
MPKCHDEVGMVFVGADDVVQSGGIINSMGTYQITLVAHNMDKPIYVAVESYKVDFLQSSLKRVDSPMVLATYALRIPPMVLASHASSGSCP